MPLLPEPLRIALFAEAQEWHMRRLRRAFERHGATVTCLSLRDCGINTAGGHPLVMRGFEDRLPDLAVVKTVPGGSFEEVTLRLGILHALAGAGIPVWNDPRAIERCVDKSMTSLLLAAAGLPTPPTWTVQGRARAVDVVDAARGAPLVLKPLFGAQGRGITLIRRSEDLPEEETVAGIYYLQLYVGADENWCDYRLFVVRGRLIAAMVRRGIDWITNVHQGAQAEPWEPPAEPAALARDAAQVAGTAYAGVDLIQAPDGSWQVLEVNSMPAWSALQRVTAVDIAGRIAAAAVADLAQRPTVRLLS